MTICASGTHHCNCQPDEGIFCYSLPVATVQREYEAKLHYVRQQLQQAEARGADLERALINDNDIAEKTQKDWKKCIQIMEGPWLLRKQAEAVEACEQEFQGQLDVIMTLSQRADSLRKEADKLEK